MHVDIDIAAIVPPTIILLCSYKAQILPKPLAENAT